MMKEKHVEIVRRGKPKSGRIWKKQQQRFCSTIKTRGIRNSLKSKKMLKEELIRVKEASRTLIALKHAEREQKRNIQKQNLKRREENRKKSEVVQIIKNTSKLKNMKKKHLKNIEKRDLNIK